MTKKFTELPLVTSVGQSNSLIAVTKDTDGTPSSAAMTPGNFFRCRQATYNVLEYASLTAALTDIGATVAELEIPTTTSVSADLTVPANVTLVFIGSGLITVSSTKTLTINGGFFAPPRQVFSGAGTVILNAPGQPIISQWWGAKADVKQVTDGSMTSGSATLTSATAGFTANDVGKVVDVSGVGASASDTQGVTARHNKVGTISGYTSSTTVTLSFTASATVSDLTVTFGTDDSAAVLKAFASKGSGNVRVHFPRGNYGVNSQISLASRTSVTGDEPGVTNLYWLGPTRNSGAGTVLFLISDGVKDVSISNLTIKGTNVAAIGVTAIGGLYSAIKPGTGATGAITNLTFRNLDIGYIWGFGLRSDGDVGAQSGGNPTTGNFRVLNSNIHHCGDNGININSTELTVSGCHLTDNGAGGIEVSAGTINIHDNYIARNKRVGIASGGLGNPALATNVIVSHNTIERNGGALTGSGIQVGGNMVHVLIDGNIIRQNELNGIGVSDGPPDFASLSRDIKISNNRIVANGVSGASGSSGIYCTISDIVIENNEIYNFDDNGSGYSQTYGVQILGCDGVKVVRNRVFNNASYDYEFIFCTNILLVRDDATSTIQQYEPNGLTGTCDTSSTTLTWKSGDLFNARHVGVVIKIASVYYAISAVAAAPTGNFTASGLTITRSTGPNFDSAWIGKYIRLGASLYFPITAVADASHLTISNSIGNTIPASGAWVLNGSISATLTTSAGTQTGAAFIIPPDPIYPANNAVSQTVPFTATPVFDAYRGNTMKITLNGANVTSSQLINGVDGQIVTFVIIQDSSARTFAWPSNVFGATTIGTSTGKYNIQSFRCMGSFWLGIAAGQINLP
jgi:hypothetical protein